MDYKVILINETGVQLDITSAAESIGWEEGEGELSMRISISLQNATYNGKLLSDIAKPNCIVVIIADDGSKAEEVARGYIINWEKSSTNSANTIDILAYDELFNLQQSQDNRYITEGTGTKAAVTSIFNDWSVPISEYKGPDIRNAKTIFKNECLSDIIIQLLDTAIKHGCQKCIVRASKGAVSVIPIGSNKVIYHFDEDSNLEVTRDKISTQDLVTRVKVVATSSDDDRQVVEAIVDGQTKFGIRQRIYNRSEDDTLATAKTSATEIINKNGVPERTIRIESPDVPFVRKGDKIHVKSNVINGYCIVKSIQHDAADRGMSMEIADEEKQSIANTTITVSSQTQTEFNKGDRVILNGAVYRDSWGRGKGKTFKDYSCAITIKVDTNRTCPYHVDGIGWVYPNAIIKA